MNLKQRYNITAIIQIFSPIQVDKPYQGEQVRSIKLYAIVNKT